MEGRKEGRKGRNPKREKERERERERETNYLLNFMMDSSCFQYTVGSIVMFSFLVFCFFLICS
jgi:hypothetical protein